MTSKVLHFHNRTGLTLAYQRKINTGDKQKDFSLEDIDDACVERMTGVDARSHGIPTNAKTISIIRFFGYVEN